ncbi:MAG: AraC family transcriptional regulator [Cognatishimia sp.]|nr:AraC family transcriptional regulator [Cognatishimia sp.]
MSAQQQHKNYVFSDLCVQRACELIEGDLTTKQPVDVLAKHAGLAEHHFQRRFAAATGETVAGYLKTRRLEQAALSLLASSDGVLDVALQFGFETHSAFSRAFKGHFGVPPAEFRRTGGKVAVSGEQPRPYLVPQPAQTVLDGFDLIAGPDLWLGWRKFTGMQGGRFFADLAKLGQALRELRLECQQTDIGVPTEDSLQIASAFSQGPKSYEDETATAYVGALFDQKLPLEWPEGWTQIPARTYAVFPHFGPLLTLPLTWNKAARVALKQSGMGLDEGTMFETYLTANPNEEPSKLSALIYLPVVKAQTEQQ